MAKRGSTPAPEAENLDGLLDQVKSGKLSRRAFFRRAAVVGASAGGAAILLAYALKTRTSPKAASPQQQQNIQQHQQHITRQTTPPPASSEHVSTNQLAATGASAALMNHLQAILDDYHPDALVEDALMGAPIQGHAAIRDRKFSEMVAIAEPHIDIARRYAVGDQVVAEWVFTGRHVGDFKGFAATGNTLRLHGVTVVTRRDGKIVKESLYYDEAEIRRQMTAPTVL